jgi:hypothetical protein
MKNYTLKKVFVLLMGVSLFFVNEIYAQRNDRNARQGRNNREERHEREEIREYFSPYNSRGRANIQIPLGNYFGYNKSYNPYLTPYDGLRLSIGFRFNLLPMGYVPIYLGGNPFYYNNGIFLNRRDNYYEVIEAPIGAEIPYLPRDARMVIIDGMKYYQSNGSYFKEIIRPNGEIWYAVTGKY